MSFLSFFNKAKPAKSNSAAKKDADTHSKQGGFVLGVEDVFPLKESENVVVVGKANGTVHVGDAVYISNVGDDEGDIFLTTVLGVEIGKGENVSHARDCCVGLMIEKGKNQKIKCGTAIYTRSISSKDVHDAYVSAMNNVFVLKNELNFTPEQEDALSATDCHEILYFVNWINEQKQNRDKETLNHDNEKEKALVNILARKLLTAKSVYCVFSKITNEPYLFSQTTNQEDGAYCCTPPIIMLITKAYEKVLAPQYPESDFEVREIANGDDGCGIHNFLGSAFYLNGACQVALNNGQIAISAEMLVPKPDYSDIPEINRPVMNPELERWLLLMAQLGDIDTPDKEIIYVIYVGFMQQELVGAQLLIPIKHEGEIPPGDENGKTVLKEGITISLATLEGKYDRPAVRMYTDWKRLNAGMGNGWEGLIQSIDGIIEKYDCAINVADDEKAGCYISKEMFNSALKRM